MGTELQVLSKLRDAAEKPVVSLDKSSCLLEHERKVPEIRTKRIFRSQITIRRTPKSLPVDSKENYA